MAKKSKVAPATNVVVDPITGTSPAAIETIAGSLEQAPVQAKTAAVDKGVSHDCDSISNLARTLFEQAKLVLSNRTVLETLTYYQQRTLKGAYLLTGQCLGESDGRGPIMIANGSALVPSEIMSLTIQQARPTVSDQDKRTDRETIMYGVERQDEKAAVDELLGLPEDITQEIFDDSIADVRTFVAAVYNAIMSARASSSWESKLHAHSRLILQGMQITAAQLLGMNDRFGAITLPRYLRLDRVDYKITSALGFARRSKE